jgi:hypothetical protein
LGCGRGIAFRIRARATHSECLPAPGPPGYREIIPTKLQLGGILILDDVDSN